MNKSTEKEKKMTSEQNMTQTVPQVAIEASKAVIIAVRKGRTVSKKCKDRSTKNKKWLAQYYSNQHLTEKHQISTTN